MKPCGNCTRLHRKEKLTSQGYCPSCRHHMENKPQRTEKQNRGGHLWFRQVADALNAGGISVQTLMRVTYEYSPDVTEKMIKGIFNKIAEVKYGKISSTELDTKQFTECAEELNRLLGNHPEVAVHIPFPSVETQEMVRHYSMLN